MDTRATVEPKQSRWSSGRGVRYAAVAWLMASASALIFLGCQGGGGRFPTCKSDADCTARESKKEFPVCVDLRCVECRSDTECQTGHACNLANECRPIGDTPTGEQDGGKKEVIEKESWEPSTSEDRDKCLAACKGKGKECTDRCGGGPAKKPPAKK
jgi:hypothetical protein